MNKGDLIEAVAKDTKLSKAAAEKAINSVIANMSKGLKKGGKVSVAGFGTFTVRKRKARMGRNPQTGEEIKIPASKTVGFKAGKALKELI